MEILNRSEKKEPSTFIVKVLTIKKCINSKKGFTGEEQNISCEEKSLDLEGLKTEIGNISLFNKEEENKLLQEGFSQNYILMKKLIR